MTSGRAPARHARRPRFETMKLPLCGGRCAARAAHRRAAPDDTKT
ncbi:hypothetical protein BMAJHU_E0084 [Burkholderia mallei JHU]|nr:hypothetical protein BMASAVP1_1301 [Burkholderia mallei SAVP1]EDK57983.1 hypothetical protein BMAJHU_E0084 [Burkholderia mallei JHU]